MAIVETIFKAIANNFFNILPFANFLYHHYQDHVQNKYLTGNKTTAGIFYSSNAFTQIV
jgi:hypothetical protein